VKIAGTLVILQENKIEMKEKRTLIVFPDEWLQYSPSVLNLYKCFNENHHTKLVYLDNGFFKNDDLVENSEKVRVGKIVPYFFRKTIGYKCYKIMKLFWTLLFIKIFDKRYDIVVAIDSAGYMPSRIFFPRTVFFSLEVEKNNYFKLCSLIGIDKLIIQSKERREYLIGEDNFIDVHYIQNAPILEEPQAVRKRSEKKRILYMGNIDFRYGLEQFIDCMKDLDDSYSLTLKGIKNENFFRHVNERYSSLVDSGRLMFDFNYIDQSKVIEYTSDFYLGVTGYDMELAKSDFNYFSSPAGKLFNYYAAGVPVIGINIVGLNSVTAFKSGVLIDEVNSASIKGAISEIESSYDTYSENCLTASKEFDFKKGFDSFIEKVDTSPRAKYNLKTYFTQGHQRSLQAKQNILTSILIKCVSIAISFLLIPLTLNYLNPVKYGIWLTITSVIGWFAFFDLGLGNGLRNKLAEAFAKNNNELARTYISTSYAILTIIIGIVYVLFITVFPFINWGAIMNTPPEMNEEINRLIFIVFSFFSLQFIIKLISMILKADQRPSMSGGINTLASLLSLIIVFVITKTTSGSILWLSVGISAANIIAPLIATVWFFSKNYRHLIPSIKYVDFKSAKDLMGLGFLFFIMQFAGLILFATDSFIIEQLYGPEEVTPYNIAFKYFSIITMGFTIITAPFWTAYTDAYHKQDFKWIRRITRKLSIFWLLLVLGVIVMLLFSNLFYKIWVGDQVKIPFILSFSMAIWVLISTWTSIFGNFLSGVEKIRLSLYHSVIVIFINIPLSIFLAKYLDLGSTGVILGTCICVLPQVVLHPMQYRKIIQNKATGIWGK
jgi:O-antigen/teichoic acid export membrane protein/glycosyltransferase involved in cell wall biosynthesis